MVLGVIKRQARRAKEALLPTKQYEQKQTSKDIEALKAEGGAFTKDRLEELQQYRSQYGMTPSQAAVYLGLAETAEGRAGDSQAVQDIQAQKSGLQAQATGQATAARDPFAAARVSLAQRAGSEIESAAQRQISAQQQAEQARARELMSQMRMGAEIRQEQLRLAREQEQDLLGGSIGRLLGGALGAGLVAATGGGALPLYMAAAGGGATAGETFGERLISDKRMKSNIKDGNDDVKALLDDMSAKKYDKLGKEEIGVLAQDVEKSSAGKKIVEEVNGVKMLKPDFQTLLTAVAHLNERLSKVEKA